MQDKNSQNKKNKRRIVVTILNETISKKKTNNRSRLIPFCGGLMDDYWPETRGSYPRRQTTPPLSHDWPTTRTTHRARGHWKSGSSHYHGTTEIFNNKNNGPLGKNKRQARAGSSSPLRKTMDGELADVIMDFFGRTMLKSSFMCYRSWAVLAEALNRELMRRVAPPPQNLVSTM